MIITAKDIMIYSYLNKTCIWAILLLVVSCIIGAIIIGNNYDTENGFKWIKKLRIPIILVIINILLLIFLPSSIAFKCTLINKYQVETQVSYDIAKLKVEQILGIR